jgi:sortase B
VHKFPDSQSFGEKLPSNVILQQWQELHSINNHFVGWLQLGDTIVNYPVVQYLEDYFDGNEFYLYNDFYGRPHYDGTLFVDWHTPITDCRRPDNTVIYGHHINAGTMFAHLVKYYAPRHGMNAYLENPSIEFATIYDDERGTYKIFAAMFVNTIEEHGAVFNYFQRRFFNNKSEFYDFIVSALDRSVFYTDVDIEFGDEILTLSTCYYPLGGDTDRFVVIARRVREGEDPTVDTAQAWANPSPLYFDYFYLVRGGQWQGRNWDTSKVKGLDDYLLAKEE